MTMDQLINVLVTITLVELMVAVGLGVAFADLVGVATNWRLMGQAALANYCVPAARWARCFCCVPSRWSPLGFLSPRFARGPRMALLYGHGQGERGCLRGADGGSSRLSALVAPLLLHWLLPLLTPGSESLHVDAGKMVFTCSSSNSCPCVLGWRFAGGVRSWQPGC